MPGFQFKIDDYLKEVSTMKKDCEARMQTALTEDDILYILESGKRAEIDAIVRAVNSHEKLLETIKSLLVLHLDIEEGNINAFKAQEIRDAAHATIPQAEGK